MNYVLTQKNLKNYLDNRIEWENIYADELGSELYEFSYYTRTLLKYMRLEVATNVR